MAAIVGSVGCDRLWQASVREARGSIGGRSGVRVFVIGGTGAIGRPAVDALVAAGHDVSALARTRQRASWLESRGARPVEVSMFDVAGLTRALEGHDAVVNLASAMPSTLQFARLGAWRETERVRTEGSATVVAAALAADVGVLVQESVAMLYADRGDGWIDEAGTVDHYRTARGNHAAEASARSFTAAGRTGIILRLGVVPVLGRPGGYMSSIHVAVAPSRRCCRRRRVCSSGPPPDGHPSFPAHVRAGGPRPRHCRTEDGDGERAAPSTARNGVRPSSAGDAVLAGCG